MDYLEDALDVHFAQEILTCASRLQSTGHTEADQTQTTLSVDTGENFGLELLYCIEGLPAAEVTDWLKLTVCVLSLKANFGDTFQFKSVAALIGKKRFL